VIGQESHAVCEGFSTENVIRTIEMVKPGLVVLVGENFEDPETESVMEKRAGPVCIAHAGSLEEGKDASIGLPGDACIVLAVKSWR